MIHKNRTMITALLGIFVLGGCGLFSKPEPIAVNVEPKLRVSPNQLCQVRALSEERSSAIKTVRGAETAGNEAGQTFLSDKLKAYEADMEIAYRSMVMSCQVYANCLNENNVDETKCLRSEANYTSARSEFFNMVREANRLAAQAKNVKHGSSHPTENTTQVADGREGRCKPECSTTANVFTDDCCPVH